MSDDPREPIDDGAAPGDTDARLQDLERQLAEQKDRLLRAVAETAPKAGAENAAACLEGYRLMEAQLALQAA